MYLFLKFNLVIFIGCLSIKDSYGCCCTCGLFHKVGCCGCNFFGCNCDYKGDGWCYTTSKGKVESPTTCTSRKRPGTIDWCEFGTLYKISGKNVSVNDPREIFHALDIDGDGHVSADEMEKSIRYLSKFRNSGGINGRLSLYQMNVTDIMHQLDLNNDGTIQPNEVDESLA